MEEAITEATPRKNRAWVVYLFFCIASLGSFWYFYRLLEEDQRALPAMQQILSVWLLLSTPLIVTPILKLVGGSELAPPFISVAKYTILFGLPVFAVTVIAARFLLEPPVSRYHAALFSTIVVNVVIPSMIAIMARASKNTLMRRIEKMCWKIMPLCGAISVVSGIVFAPR